MKYRLYIDEVGNPGLGARLQHPNERYLSLSGVIIEFHHVDSVVAPRFEELKRRYFKTHVDVPLIFHRKELVNRRHPFHELNDPDTETAFNDDLLGLMQVFDYTSSRSSLISTSICSVTKCGTMTRTIIAKKCCSSDTYCGLRGRARSVTSWRSLVVAVRIAG